MKIHPSLSNLAGLLLGSMLLISCGASGPTFQPVSPPPGKGVVYIYRQGKFAGGGVFGTVKANEQPITKIRNGGYFPYIGPPGDTRFEVTTEVTNKAIVRVEPDKPKYLKTTVGMGFFVGHLKFAEVSPSIGADEIGECKLLEPISQ